MNSMRIQFLLTGITTCISLLLMITTTYGSFIKIGGIYTVIGNIVIVTPIPGATAQANGTGLRNVLAGIQSDINYPRLIKLGPGIYDLGTEGLQMKEFVSIEGSGEMPTKITAAVSSNTFPPTVATLMVANNTELRSLTVENTGAESDFTVAILTSSESPSLIQVTATAAGGPYNYGVFNTSSSPTMTNVTATADGGGYNYGVYNYFSSPKMTNVIATASGVISSSGVLNDYSSPTMTNVTATALGGNFSIGVSNEHSGTVTINHSLIRGATNAVYNGSGVTTRIGDTQLDGGAINPGTGTLTCAGVYDGNYASYTCP